MNANLVTIVMVEDNPIDAELVAHYLKREGFNCQVKRVETHCALESALCEDPPAAILCDLTLPSFSGLEALDIVHRVAPNVPFMFFSGHTHGPVAEAVRARGSTLLSKDNYKHVADLLRKIIATAPGNSSCSSQPFTPAHSPVLQHYAVS